jgi:signal transduction histidine kinase
VFIDPRSCPSTVAPSGYPKDKRQTFRCETEGRSVNVDITVPISCEQDIVAARHRGRTLALALRFPPAQATLIATAISELARNIVASAESGEIKLTVVPESGREGIQVVARQQGSGIRDPGVALGSALSRSGGLGLGLPGVRRVADEFDIVSEEQHGMTAVFKKWNTVERRSGEWGVGRPRDENPELERSYSKRLEEYLRGGGEDALRNAYELGRAAHKGGVGLLGIAALHHTALAGLLQRARGDASFQQELEKAGEFFGETLSPYEMARLGHQDAVSALRRVNETLEQEIQRIAHAVHDEAGQLLVAARLALAAAASDLAPSGGRRLEEVGAILERLDDELRRLSHELRPRILDDLGLVPAVEFLAAGLSKRSGLAVHVRSSLRDRLDPNVETTLYRVIQESLTNVVKHSRASAVEIQLGREGKDLCCVIRDDGAGFDVSAVLAGKEGSGLGLLGMRERVGAVGGELEIDAQPNRGTEVRVRIPVER